LAGLLFLPWLSVSWQFVSRFTGDFDPAMPQVVLWRGLQAFGGSLIARPPQLSVWAVSIIAVAVIGCWQLWRSDRSAALLLLLYVVIPFAGIMALTLRGQAFTERYLIAALPPYLIWLAVGIIWLWQWQRWAAGLLLAVLIGVNAQAAIRYQTDQALAKSPEWRQAFDYIAAHQQPQAEALLYDFPEAAVTYYLDTRLGGSGPELPVFLVPPAPHSTPDQVATYLAPLLADYQRVWFVPVNVSGWDDDSLVETWLMRHTDRLAQFNQRWVRADLLLTPAEIERTMRSQAATFANGITLRGFQVFNTIDAGPDQVRVSDSRLDLSLYWSAAGATQVPLTVFTQLIDATGFRRGGQDNQPVGGTYPTTAWQPHEAIVDQYQLVIPSDAPSGEYQLWVGLYDPQTGERVAVVDETGTPIADHITLTVKVILEQ
jgi:hypothetical protein